MIPFIRLLKRALQNTTKILYRHHKKFYMKKHFLEDETYALAISKIVILFQSMVTFLICVCIGLSLVTPEGSITILKGLVYLDIAFIFLHLLYRTAYFGKKITTSHSEKRILLFHVVNALMAIGISCIYIQEKNGVNFLLATIAIIFWLLSLYYGIVFFNKKYKHCK